MVPLQFTLLLPPPLLTADKYGLVEEEAHSGVEEGEEAEDVQLLGQSIHIT